LRLKSNIGSGSTYGTAFSFFGRDASNGSDLHLNAIIGGLGSSQNIKVDSAFTVHN
jgi:hypothetical protein